MNDMQDFRVWLVAAAVWMGWATGATAYGGTWHVAENLRSKTCYRVHAISPRDGWKDQGEFNTFRMAGAWIWQHRDLCRASSVFEGFQGGE